MESSTCDKPSIIDRVNTIRDNTSVNLLREIPESCIADAYSSDQEEERRRNNYPDSSPINSLEYPHSDSSSPTFSSPDEPPSKEAKDNSIRERELSVSKELLKLMKQDPPLPSSSLFVKRWKRIRKRKNVPCLHPAAKVQRTIYCSAPSQRQTESLIEDEYSYADLSY